MAQSPLSAATSSMAAVASTASAALNTTASAMTTSSATAAPAHAANVSTFGLLGRVILTILRVIPGLLYWIITFTTISLPTWLFTLFSTTLTFTMNFTTL